VSPGDREKIFLENKTETATLTALPDAQNRPTEGFQPAEVLSGLREICPTEPQGAGLAREIRTDREIESITAWTDARGLLSTRSRPPQTDELTGGEHFVEIHEETGLVFKSTRPGKFGFGVDVELVHPRGWKSRPRITAGLVDATPEEYLFRLIQQNELFGDEVRVMGAVRYPQGVSILTSQPFYPGNRTEQAVIDSWFESRGWIKIQDKAGAYYAAGRDLLIMDALPRNVLTLENGEIMPFDVVIVRPSESLKSKLGL
jgi:hypothetical protein